MGYEAPYVERQVTYRRTGEGELFTDPDVDRAREHFRAKSRSMVPKVTTVRQAVADLISDGDYLAVGGFGGSRIPTAVLHEIVRQGRRNLGLSGHTATHDCQILAAGKCFDRCDVAYVVGLEARGLSRAARRLFESGEVRVTEWSNAALAWRYKAAAMGVPFLPIRSVMGTDTEARSAGVRVECPFTGKTFLAVPALFPDVAVIHVHRADVYGNSQIDGITIADWDLARAAKRLIITTERLVPHEDIRRRPDRTAIPYFLVDAVCEVPYGSYPGNMPYEYYSDERHLREWLDAEENEEVLKAFLDRYIYGVSCFSEYLDLCGGIERLRELRAEELCLEAEGRTSR
ncbi:MAG: CoA-transferase [Bacillota bacterium]|jgi:glutaconate CoA-transferase subunit A